MNRPVHTESCTFTVDGKKVNGSVEIHRRKGSVAPWLLICIIDGKRYTPFAIKKSKVKMTLDYFGLLFKIVYAEKVRNLIPETPSALLSIIPKDDLWKGSVFLPIKGN